jgi:hypothetical protein
VQRAVEVDRTAPGPPQRACLRGDAIGVMQVVVVPLAQHGAARGGDRGVAERAEAARRRRPHEPDARIVERVAVRPDRAEVGFGHRVGDDDQLAPRVGLGAKGTDGACEAVPARRASGRHHEARDQVGHVPRPLWIAPIAGRAGQRWDSAAR